MLRSLTQRQVLIFGGALSLLAIILSAGATLLINKIAEETSDRLLAASARAIAERVGVENGEITFEMPPSALGMLEDSARDNIYYSISLGGRVITGYEDFPNPSSIASNENDEPQFRYDEYLGQRVRVAAQTRNLPRLSRPVVVQIAETLDQRHELATIMLGALAVLEFLLVVTALIITKPAVRWGLKPLIHLQDEIRTRGENKSILEPLDVTLVPQELAGLVEAFNGLLKRESKATEQTRRFTANASHQMRTPLAILRTHLDVISNKARANPDISRSFEDIDAAAERLQRLLTQLLALARAEEATVPEYSPDCEVNAVAMEECREFAPTAIAAGLEIHFHATHRVVAPIPALLLTEILGNLFDNASKYHETGSHILVCVGFDGCPFVTVEDDGQGIPKHLIQQASDRFSRLARDTDKPGSGLGLPIVNAICESVGAKLTLATEDEPRRFVARIDFPSGRAIRLDAEIDC